jgi:heme exporter protein C
VHGERRRVYGKGLRALSIATATALAVAVGLIFFYAPVDADQGFVQKIFYVHVPMGIVALSGFVAGGLMAVRHLRTGDRAWDLRAYVAIHLSLILSVGVLLTGMIWAKASWGHWWVWNEPALVSFLIVFLLYCCYQPLRFSIEDPERQARYASVFAIAAGAFVPLNFGAVRLAQAYTHPRVLSQTGGNLPGEMRLTFLMALTAVALLFATLWRLELTAKNAGTQLKRLRRALEEDADASHAAVASPRREPAAPPAPAAPTTVPARSAR